MIPTGLSKDQEEAYLCKYSIFILIYYLVTTRVRQLPRRSSR